MKQWQLRCLAKSDMMEKRMKRIERIKTDFSACGGMISNAQIKIGNSFAEGKIQNPFKSVQSVSSVFHHVALEIFNL